jgi:hypothetical protein
LVKIENLSPDARVTFVREGNPQVARVGYLLDSAEFESLKVETGTVTYSIDELEVVTVSAAPIPLAETTTKKIVFPNRVKK